MIKAGAYPVLPRAVAVSTRLMSLNSDAENQEVLARQEGMLLVHHVAGLRELGFHALRRNAGCFRRTVGRIQAKVDHRETAAGLEGSRELAEVALAVFNVVVDVHQQNEICLCRKPRILRG